MKTLIFIGALLVSQVSNAEYLESLKIKRVVDGDTVHVFYQDEVYNCLLYTSPSPRDVEESRMPASA